MKCLIVYGVKELKLNSIVDIYYNGIEYEYSQVMMQVMQHFMVENKATDCISKHGSVSQIRSTIEATNTPRIFALTNWNENSIAKKTFNEHEFSYPYEIFSCNSCTYRAHKNRLN